MLVFKSSVWGFWVGGACRDATERPTWLRVVCVVYLLVSIWDAFRLFPIFRKGIFPTSNAFQESFTYRSKLPLSLIIQRHLLILDIDADKPKLKTLFFRIHSLAFLFLLLLPPHHPSFLLTQS